MQEASIAAKKAREIVEIARKNRELLENGVQSKRQGRRGASDLIGEEGFRVEIDNDTPVSAPGEDQGIPPIPQTQVPSINIEEQRALRQQREQQARAQRRARNRPQPSSSWSCSKIGFDCISTCGKSILNYFSFLLGWRYQLTLLFLLLGQLLFHSYFLFEKYDQFAQMLEQQDTHLHSHISQYLKALDRNNKGREGVVDDDDDYYGGFGSHGMNFHFHRLHMGSSMEHVRFVD